jgi:hypothetical protein
MTTLEAAVLDRPRAYARYPYHPLAEVLPLLTGREFDDLVEDIGKNGLRDPINLFEGRIIDGRNRERACLKAGVEPRYRSIGFANHDGGIRDLEEHPAAASDARAEARIDRKITKS